MEQNIEYTGMTSQPSDYACGDGEMKLAVNAEYRDGGYHAVRVPKDVEFKKEGFEPLYVHRPERTCEIYIGVEKNEEENFILCAINAEKTNVEFNSDIKVGTLEAIGNIASIGNILMCTVNGRIVYYRYANNAYEQIDISNTEHPILQFAANRVPFIPQELNNFKQIYTENEEMEGQFNVKIALTDSELDDGLNSDADNAYIGLVYKKMNELKKQCALVFPVFVRYAVKMYDGNYCYISPPILIHPFADVLSASYKDVEYRSPNYSGNDGRASLFVTNPKVYMTAYYVSMKISTEAMSKIKKYKEMNGLIAGIDLYISKEIYTYDLKHIYAHHNDTNSTNSLSFKKLLEWKKELDKVSEFYLVKSYSINELTKKKENQYNDVLNIKGILSDVDYDTLEDYTEREKLDMSKTTGENLLCRNIYTYNNRILTIGSSYSHKEPFVLSMFVTPIMYYNNNLPTGRYEYDIPDEMQTSSLYAYTGKINNIRIIKQSNGHKIVLDAKSGDTVYLPIYYYYPQSGCTDIIISTKIEGRILNYEMQDCDFLTGSRCIFGRPNTDYASAPAISDKEPTEENVVKASEVNNPFVFKDGNSVSCGTGSILSIAINARAVSQGQFGQYPLYAFCTDAVYAIGISSDGTLQNCVPFSYDILSNADSVANMEKNIVFVSNQGLIMFGDNGRQLLLLADKNATYAYDQGKNDHQKTFVSGFLNKSNYSSPEYTDMYTYLTSGAKMAYDYSHGRLIMYNPKYDYSYIMEAKSGMWSIMDKSFSRRLNVYEKCLLVDKDGQTVYDYSSDNVFEEQKSYLITRPFKLGAPDTHKSVQSIIQRGVFCNKEDVKQCLYASNDLYNWVPVKSSNSIYMRGMRGTGYKYFRQILFLPNFKQNEVLHGASITYEPRLTNKMR